jgi:hypothetical protein
MGTKHNRPHHLRQIIAQDDADNSVEWPKTLEVFAGQKGLSSKLKDAAYANNNMMTSLLFF